MTQFPEAWVNRSETLELLNELSTTYTYKMIKEVIRGYECAIKVREMYSFMDCYLSKKNKVQRKCIE